MDINIKVNKITRQVLPDKNKIGVDGENLQEQLIFYFEDDFVDGIGRLEYEHEGEKHYIPLTKTDETYVVPIKNVITKAWKINMQLVITEPENEDGIPLFKSNIFEMYVTDSINAVGEAPDDYDLWIDVINAKLLEMDNINIDANKVGKITTITITYKDGTTKEVELEDGMGLDYDWQGTSLGVKREDESTYQYTNLKGDKGEPGAIKMIIVAELPATGQDDTIYLVPLATPESQENNYAEYVYINGNWELLGKIGIQVDLTDYYTKTETNGLLDTKQALIDSSHKLSSDLVDDTNKTNKFVTETDKTNWNDKISPTDYATTNKGGVIKINSYYNTGVSQNGNLISNVRTYQQYLNDDDYSFVSTKTLKNVLTGTIGNIDSVLDAINGEVI